jgi:hypothetical protein
MYAYTEGTQGEPTDSIGGTLEGTIVSTMISFINNNY